MRYCNLRQKYCQNLKIVKKFVLKNKNKLSVEFCDSGARLFSIKTKKSETYIDLLAGPSDFEKYISNDLYAGAICGRYANRIANAECEINGKKYFLSKNEGYNHLHGGKTGLNAVVWNVESINLQGFASAYKLNYLSKHGQEGYPGNLDITVVYALSDNNEFYIKLNALTDKPTCTNLCSHPYFNLNGGGSALDHELQIFADNYTPLDKFNIPTGEILKVDNTCFDFRKKKKIEDVLKKFNITGFDNNFVLNNFDGKLRLAAILQKPGTERKIELYTTQPGLQLYTATHFGFPLTDKNGAISMPGGGIALEAQNFADAPNHSNFPNSVLFPGEKYEHEIIYKIYF